MVKVGFICEGETEKIIIESPQFQSFLIENNIGFVKAIDATGNGNLLPKNIHPFINLLKDEMVEKIIVLTDLDEDLCITKTKERIGLLLDINIIVSVKKIESWFLADSKTLSALLKANNYQFEFPEKEINPFEVIKNIFVQKTNRGIGSSKILFAKRMINYGFSVLNAANHPNCESAKYFINKLKSIHL